MIISKFCWTSDGIAVTIEGTGAIDIEDAGKDKTVGMVGYATTVVKENVLVGSNDVTIAQTSQHHPQRCI